MDLAATGALFIGEEFVQRLENCDVDTCSRVSFNVIVDDDYTTIFMISRHTRSLRSGNFSKKPGH